MKSVQDVWSLFPIKAQVFHTGSISTLSEMRLENLVIVHANPRKAAFHYP